MWIAAAGLSAVFAGLTAILSKCGVKNVNSDMATAVRTSVVLAFAWAIVCATGAGGTLSGIGAKSWLFLVLSGLATGASWLCYFRALSLGEVAKVAAVDKSSVIFSALFAIAIFPGERAFWRTKLVCLAAIAAGTFLMTSIPREKDVRTSAWLIFALLSAVFAAASSVLAKVGIENVDPNAATAIRTCVVFVMAWLVVLCRNEAAFVKKLRSREIAFLVLSGLATGASWLCFYYAMARGQVSVVVPIDKLSILITTLFSVTALKERLPPKAWAGLALIAAGTVCMALCSTGSPTI